MEIRGLLFGFIGLGLVTGSSVVASGSEAGDGVVEILAKHEKFYRETVLAGHEKALADLSAKYTAALQREMDQATAAGDLEAVLGIREELGRLEKREALPADDKGISPSMGRLRKAFREAMARLDADHRTKASGVVGAIEKELVGLEEELTKEFKVEEALEVRAARAKLQKEGAPFLTIVVAVPEADGSAAAAAVNVSGVKARGGRIRSFGPLNENQKPYDLSKAEAIEDFVRVQVLEREEWAGIRSDGTVVSTDANFDGKRGVAEVDNGILLYRDGRIEVFDGEEKERGKDGVSLCATMGSRIALLRTGGVAFWGEKYEQPGMRLPPEELKDVVALTSAWGMDSPVYGVQKDGTVLTWGLDSKKSVLPASLPGVVALDAGWRHVAALTKEGKVLAWPGNVEAARVPTDLPRIVRIVAECAITVAQKEDLSWVAWGDNTGGARDRINSMGPALDLSFQVNANSGVYLLWIEP